MGWLMRKRNWSQGRAQAVFLPLVLGAIAIGPMLPLDIASLLPEGMRIMSAWNVILLT